MVKNDKLVPSKFKEDYINIENSKFWTNHSFGLYNMFNESKLKGYLTIVSLQHHYLMDLGGHNNDYQVYNFEETHPNRDTKELIKKSQKDKNCIGIVPINHAVKKSIIDKFGLNLIVEGIGIKNLHNSNEIPERYRAYK